MPRPNREYKVCGRSKYYFRTPYNFILGYTGVINSVAGKRELFIMNLKNKISMISCVAAMALVGTGYAAWTFSKDATQTATGNVNITAKADEVGTLTVDNDSFYLVIDQGFLGWATTQNATASDISKVVLTYSGAEGKSTADNTNWKIDETIKFTCTFDGSALSEYIVFTNVADTEYTKSYTGLADITLDYNLPTVSWKDGAKPENETEYDAMVTAIGSTTVDLSFTAEVDECTH